MMHYMFAVYLALDLPPEFEAWLSKMKIMQSTSDITLSDTLPPAFAKPLGAITGGGS